MGYRVMRRRSQLVPEGEHFAKMVHYSVKEGVRFPFGTRDIVKFNFCTESGHHLFKDAVLYLSPSSTLGKTCSALLGEVPNTLDLDDLLDRECGIVVEHKKSRNGHTFATITEFFEIEYEDEEDDEEDSDLDDVK